MNVICVDDEELILQHTVSLCRSLERFDQVWGFSSATKALAWSEDHTIDLALLDIDMPDMKGLDLASGIRKANPDTAILFLTGYEQYAVDAFAMHASGYLLKPVSRERLLSEVEYVLFDKGGQGSSRIVIRTFGHFDVFADGELITFKRSKAKELLALLVDRQGAGITRAEAYAMLWEEGVYDRPAQKQFDVIVRSLKSTLSEFHADGIVDMEKGVMRVRPETFDCDLYRFLKGDEEAVNSYRGEYMGSYPWASMTEGYMSHKLEPR